MFPIGTKNSLNKVVIFCVCLLAALGGCTQDSRSDEERVALARQNIEEHRYRDAIIEMRNLLQVNKRSIDARLILGEALLAIGDMETAQKEAFRARDLGATPNQYLETLARSLQGTGNHIEVISEVDASGIDDPELASTLRAIRGWSMLQLESIEQADEVFEQELAVAVSTEAQRISLLGKASMATKQGQLEQAESYIQQALVLIPNEPDSLLALGRLYISQSKYQAARDLITPVRKGAIRAEPQQKFFIEGQYTEALLGLGELDLARESIAELESLGVSHPMYAFLKGRLEFQTGSTDAAIKLFQQVLAEYPNYTPALTLIGVALIEQEDVDQAEMFLTRSVANDPGNVRTRRLLAETRLRMGRNRAAVRTLKDGLSRDDADAELLTMLGRATMQGGQQEEGLKYLQEVYAASPESPNAGVVLASAYLSMGNSRDAIRTLESIPNGSIDENRRQVLIRVANLDRSDQRRAETQIEQLLSDTDNDPYITGLAGSFFAAIGKEQRARALFRQILENAPGNRAAMLNILSLDERSGDYTESLALFESAHAADQNDLLPTMVLARIYESMGDAKRAIDLVFRANVRDPSALLPNLMLAANAIRESNFETADKYASAAVANYPRSAQAHALYGLSKMHLGDLAEFQSAFERAVVLEPDNVQYNYYLGKAAWAGGQILEARTRFQKVVQSDTPYLPAMRSLAVLHAEIGRASQADKLVDDIQSRFGGTRRALVAIGDIRAAQIKREQAELAYEEAQSISPSWYVATELYELRKSGEMADPTRSLRQWREQSPDDLRAQLKIAQYHHEVGNENQAIEEYERLLALESNSIITLNNIAWLYFDRDQPGDRARAVDMARSAYELAEKNPFIADTYGWLLFQTGEIQQSRDILRAAFLATGPERSPDIAYHYAVIQQQKDGLDSSAREILQNALQSDRPFANREEAHKLLTSINDQHAEIEAQRLLEESQEKARQIENMGENPGAQNPDTTPSE